MSSWITHTGKLLVAFRQPRLLYVFRFTCLGSSSSIRCSSHYSRIKTFRFLRDSGAFMSPFVNTNGLAAKSVIHDSCRRYASKRKRKKVQEDDTSSGSESDSDVDDMDDDLELEDDPDAPSNYKVMKLHVKSLRVDSIVSGGLDIARNRVDEMVFSNKLRYNGDKLLKKSKQVSTGDFVDVITERDEDVLKVKRVKVIKILSEKTKTDKHNVQVKVWKQPFEILNETKEKW